jgi:acyl-CoA synthetase (AMP-forming)/AMP-acid ligase II
LGHVTSDRSPVRDARRQRGRRIPIVGTPLPPPLRLPDLLSVGLAARPDDTAVASLELRWTWADPDTTAAGLGLRGDDGMLPGSSISHPGALQFSFAALSVGAPVLVARSFLRDEILPLLRRDRPTVLCMLPAILVRLVRDGHASAGDFRPLRLVRSGSDKVPAELEAEFTDLTGHDIDEGDGCSETGLATLNPPEGPIIACSIGRPLPGVDLSIRDPTGWEIPVDGIGELWIRSPSLTPEYWNDPAATASVMQDCWFNGGDVMRAYATGA